MIKVESEIDVYRDVFGTAPPVSPVSRVHNHAEDPRNLDAAESGGNEHQLVRHKGDKKYTNFKDAHIYLTSAPNKLKLVQVTSLGVSNSILAIRTMPDEQPVFRKITGFSRQINFP